MTINTNELNQLVSDAAAKRAEKAGKKPVDAATKAARVEKRKQTIAAKKAGVHVQDLPLPPAVIEIDPALLETAATMPDAPVEKTIFNDSVLACEEMHRMLNKRNKAAPSRDTDIAIKHCKPYTLQTLIDLGVIDREFFDMFSRHDKKLAQTAKKNFVPVKVQVKIFDTANCIAQGLISLLDQYSAALIANSFLNGGKLHRSLVALSLQKKLEYSDDALAYANGKMLRYRCNVAASTASTQGSSSKGENGMFKYLKLGHFDNVSGLLHLDLENKAVKRLCEVMMLASDEAVAELTGANK